METVETVERRLHDAARERAEAEIRRVEAEAGQQLAGAEERLKAGVEQATAQATHGRDRKGDAAAPRRARAAAEHPARRAPQTRAVALRPSACRPS